MRQDHKKTILAGATIGAAAGGKALIPQKKRPNAGNSDAYVTSPKTGITYPKPTTDEGWAALHQKDLALVERRTRERASVKAAKAKGENVQGKVGTPEWDFAQSVSQMFSKPDPNKTATGEDWNRGANALRDIIAEKAKEHLGGGVVGNFIGDALGAGISAPMQARAGIANVRDTAFKPNAKPMDYAAPAGDVLANTVLPGVLEGVLGIAGNAFAKTRLAQAATGPIQDFASNLKRPSIPVNIGPPGPSPRELLLQELARRDAEAAARPRGPATNYGGFKGSINEPKPRVTTPAPTIKPVQTAKVTDTIKTKPQDKQIRAQINSLPTNKLEELVKAHDEAVKLGEVSPFSESQIATARKQLEKRIASTPEARATAAGKPPTADFMADAQASIDQIKAGKPTDAKGTLYHGTMEAFDAPRSGLWWSTDKDFASAFANKKGRSGKSPRVIERGEPSGKIADFSDREVGSDITINEAASKLGLSRENMLARLTDSERHIWMSNEKFGGTRLFIGIEQGGLGRLAEESGFSAIKAAEKKSATELAPTYKVFDKPQGGSPGTFKPPSQVKEYRPSTGPKMSGNRRLKGGYLDLGDPTQVKWFDGVVKKYKNWDGIEGYLKSIGETDFGNYKARFSQLNSGKIASNAIRSSRPIPGTEPDTRSSRTATPKGNRDEPSTFTKLESTASGLSVSTDVPQRLLDVGANTVRTAATSAEAPLRAPISRAIAKASGMPEVGGRIDPTKAARVWSHTPGEVRKLGKAVIEGTDAITLDKSGGGRMKVANLGGVTDVPFRVVHRISALDDVVTNLAEAKFGKGLPNGGKAWRDSALKDMVDGKKPAWMDDDKFKAYQKGALEWSEDMSYNGDNFVSKAAEGARVRLAQDKPGWRKDVSVATLNRLTRFGKVITNVTADAAERTPYGVIKGLTEAVEQIKLGKVGKADMFAINKASERIVKGATGSGLVALGYYAPDIIDIKLKKTESGQYYIDVPDWLDQLGGPLKSVITGASIRLIKDAPLTPTQKANLATKLLLPGLNNPVTGNMKRIADADNTASGFAKAAEYMVARDIPGFVKRGSIIIDSIDAAKSDPQAKGDPFAYWAEAVFGQGRKVEKSVKVPMFGGDVNIPVGPILERTPFKTYPKSAGGKPNTTTKKETVIKMKR